MNKEHNILDDQTETETAKQTKPKSPYKNECLTCRRCNFKGKSKLQMEKHMKVAHEDRPVCQFWLRGCCSYGNQC